MDKKLISITLVFILLYFILFGLTFPFYSSVTLYIGIFFFSDRNDFCFLVSLTLLFHFVLVLSESDQVTQLNTKVVTSEEYRHIEESYVKQRKVSISTALYLCEISQAILIKENQHKTLSSINPIYLFSKCRSKYENEKFYYLYNYNIYKIGVYLLLINSMIFFIIHRRKRKV